MQSEDELASARDRMSRFGVLRPAARRDFRGFALAIVMALRAGRYRCRDYNLVVTSSA